MGPVNIRYIILLGQSNTLKETLPRPAGSMPATFRSVMLGIQNANLRNWDEELKI